MLRKNKVKIIISSIVCLLPIIAGIILWNQLPDTLATHWGVSGEANGYSSKAFAVIGIPSFLFAIHALCLAVTFLDPKNKNQSPKVFGIIFLICPVMSLFVCGSVYSEALGYKLNMSTPILILVGLLFLIIGNYLPKCRQNSTIGIKIKWTLENEKNWNATHRFAGKIWAVGGILLILCVFLPGEFSIWAIIVIIPAMVAPPMIYSYRLYKKGNT